MSFKSTDIGIYHTEYTIMKSLESIYHTEYTIMKSLDSQNPLYLIFNNVDGYIEEGIGNKYVIVASTDNNKEVLKKYT